MTNLAPLADFVFEHSVSETSDKMNSTATSAPISKNENVVRLTSPSTGFDYSGVSDEIANEAEATAWRIRSRHRDSIIATGNDLISIKSKLAHGQFGSWLTFHFNMSERSAQNYMNAASVFGSAPKVIDALPATTIYKLAGKGVPTFIRQSVIDDVKDGVSLEAKDIENRIINAKQEKRIKEKETLQAKREVRDWSKHELAMKKASKGPEEIEAERKIWETKTARAQREKENKLAAANKAKDQNAFKLSEQQDRKQQMEKLALRATAILKERLASKFEDFRDIIIKIDYSEFQKALQKA